MSESRFSDWDQPGALGKVADPVVTPICEGKHVRVVRGVYAGMAGTVDDVDGEGVWIVWDGEPALGFGVEEETATGPFSPEDLEPAG